MSKGQLSREAGSMKKSSLQALFLLASCPILYLVLETQGMSDEEGKKAIEITI